MDAKAYIALFAGAVALAAFLTTFFEYRRQGAAKRADRFIEMRQRLRGNAEFVQICALLESDDQQLREVPLLVKDNFVGFFEELTLLWNSKVFNDQVVFYMFGYFAIKCWRSKNFWADLNREQQLWGHFRDMVSRLEDLQKSFKVDRRQYRV